MRGDPFSKKIAGLNAKKYLGILSHYIGNCSKHKEYSLVNLFAVVFHMIKKADSLQYNWYHSASSLFVCLFQDSRKHHAKDNEIANIIKKTY